MCIFSLNFSLGRVCTVLDMEGEEELEQIGKFGHAVCLTPGRYARSMYGMQTAIASQGFVPHNLGPLSILFFISGVWPAKPHCVV